MSLALLKTLCGQSAGRFAQFISHFDGVREPRIAWYPSAGGDFRSLLYLHQDYLNMHPAQGHDPLPPDLFLFTDYFPWEYGNFLDTRILYTDLRTTITVETIEELPKLKLPVKEKFVAFPEGSIATNRVVFMTVNVECDKLGSFTRPVLYCFAENTAFCCDLMLKMKARVSHVIHVRYGGGLGGGGTASGAWILKALKLLGTEVYITDNHHYWQEGDKLALELYPVLGHQTEPEFTTIRTIDGRKWSEHGDVSWNLVQL